MRKQLLNRRAQEYLVRGKASLPTVAAPGPDTHASADWFIGSTPSSGIYQLVDLPNMSRALEAEDGAVHFEELASGSAHGKGWLIRPVQDGSEYCYLESVADPGLLLACASSPSGSDGFDLVVQRDRDRAAMWLLSDQCVADARSIHLRYTAPPNLSMFYNEVYPDVPPPGTFYCTSGFGANARGRNPSGYAGVQRLPDGTGLAIFSVWHRMVDEVRPRPDSLATAVGAHPRAEVTNFSGEGSGSSVRLPLEGLWAKNPKVRVVLTAEALGRDTVINAYMGVDQQPWQHLGAILRAETHEGLMEHPYAFVEDFARTGNKSGMVGGVRSPYQMRSARFANQWYRVPTGRLTPVTEATFTVYSPHPLENVSAVSQPHGKTGIRVATGGSSAEHAPPIGARYTEDATHRQAPDLTGVPYA